MTLERAADCLASYARHISLARGGSVEEWNGIVLGNSRSPSEYRNMVVPLAQPSSSRLAGLVDELRSFYGSMDGWVIWSVFPLELESHGLAYRMSNPLMLRSSDAPVIAERVRGLTIKEALTDSEILAFERMRATTQNIPSLKAADDNELFGSSVLAANHQLWLGTMNGQLVATSASFQAGGLNMVKNVGVLPEFRGQGIGSAMSAHADAASPLSSVLDADPDAVNMYSRLGFEEIGRMHFWASTPLSSSTGW